MEQPKADFAQRSCNVSSKRMNAFIAWGNTAFEIASMAVDFSLALSQRPSMFAVNYDTHRTFETRWTLAFNKRWKIHHAAENYWVHI
jgi:hypothetical protein